MTVNNKDSVTVLYTTRDPENMVKPYSAEEKEAKLVKFKFAEKTLSQVKSHHDVNNTKQQTDIKEVLESSKKWLNQRFPTNPQLK